MLRLGEYARRMGFSRAHAYQMFAENRLPHPAVKISPRVILVDVPADFELSVKKPTGIVGYARVSTKKQQESLENQKARIATYALDNGIRLDKIVCEIGSGLNDNRRQLLKILNDPSVGTIVVEHKDRLSRMCFGLIEASLKSRGCSIVVMDDSESDDDLVTDITDVLTVLCARFYGRRGARARAKSLVADARGD